MYTATRGAHVNQLSNRPQRVTTRQVDPSSYISHPTSAAGGHSRLGWLTRDQHSHSIEVIAFQKLVLGSTALHFLPSEFVVACKFRLGLPVYDQPGPCPSCGMDSDILCSRPPAGHLDTSGFSEDETYVRTGELIVINFMAGFIR